jgi:hypothetical protein
MTALYVANTTKQNHRFYYRLAESSRTVYEDIMVGAQARIGHDLTQADIEIILKHHARYGMRKASEVNRNFVGLVYSVGKPVVLDDILETFEKNDTAMDERAGERMEEVAAAVASSMQTMIGQPLARVEVETVEETTGGDTPAVAKGFEVLGEGVPPRHGSKRAKRRGRSQA